MCWKENTRQEKGVTSASKMTHRIKSERPLPLHEFIWRGSPQSLQPKISNNRPHPTVFYNLSGYDAHLFIKELRKRFNKNNIGVIAENKEKYINFK